MANDPVKTEQYQNIGGVNRKASPFMLAATEVLDIANFDYQQPGGFGVRPGSTPIFSGFTYPINSFFQFGRLNGASYEIWNANNNVYCYSGNSAIGFTTTLLRQMGITLPIFSPQTGITTPTFFGTTGLLSMVPFVDRLFVAGANIPASGQFLNGLTYAPFFKTDGNTAYAFSLPPPYYSNQSYPGPISGITTSGIYLSAQNSGVYGNPSTSSSFIGLSGLYQYAFAWLNDRGYIGPIGYTGFLAYGVSGGLSILNSGNGLGTLPGIQVIGLSAGQNSIWGFSSIVFGFSILGTRVIAPPVGFGITAIVVFRGGPFPVTTSNFFAAQLGITYLGPLYDLAVIPLGSTQFIDYGTTTGPLTATGNTLYSQSLWFTQVPSFVDIFNNSLLLFGFSSNPSTVYFSAIGEPELVGNTASFDVRTNDADYLSGGKNFYSQYCFFKTRSFHSFTGDNPSNYSLRQVSDQYGCVSHRATAVYNSYLLFLDRKGIAQYDGQNVQIISDRVEPTFRRMNYQAALNQAAMLHVKDRNEVWCAFPIDGATINNYMVVYDYLANAFSEWQGPQIASLALATEPTSSRQYPFYGDYSGVIQYFGYSLWTDSGRAFTCTVTPRYFGAQGVLGGNAQEMGYSIEKMFRRLYLDITDSNNRSGATTAFTVKLFSDFTGSTVQASQTFALWAGGHTQVRLDFDVPGKAAAFQLLFVPQTSALQFNGYTMEFRFQRAV